MAKKKGSGGKWLVAAAIAGGVYLLSKQKPYNNANVGDTRNQKNLNSFTDFGDQTDMFTLNDQLFPGAGAGATGGAAGMR